MKPYVLNNLRVFDESGVTSNQTSALIDADQMSVMLFHVFITGGNGTIFFEYTNFPIENNNITPVWYEHSNIIVTGSSHAIVNPVFVPVSKWRVRWQHVSGSVTLRVYASGRAF